MKATKPKIFGLILAGGFSQRMGQDKALLQFHGKPQIENIYNLLNGFCEKVFLSKRTDQKPYKNFDFINDAPEYSNHGPLVGILSAMKEYPGTNWLVMACDLPYISEEAILKLLSQRDPQKQATAFISSQDGLPEPLCAIWEGSFYDSILKLFKEGTYCPRKILIKSKVQLIDQDNPHWLDNINTPQEYEKVNLEN